MNWTSYPATRWPMHSSAYRNDRFEASLLLENVLDLDYENFGLIGEEPDEVVGLDDIGEDVRFLAPGAPRSAWLRVKLIL